MASKRHDDNATAEGPPTATPGPPLSPAPQQATSETQPTITPGVHARVKARLAETTAEFQKMHDRCGDLGNMLNLQRARATKAEADLNRALTRAAQAEEQLTRTQTQLAAKTEECRSTHQQLARHLTRTGRDQDITARCIDKLTRAAQDIEVTFLRQHEALSLRLNDAKAAVAEDVANLSWSPHTSPPPATSSPQRVTIPTPGMITHHPRATTSTQQSATPASHAPTLGSPPLCFAHLQHGANSWSCHAADCPMRRVLLEDQPSTSGHPPSADPTATLAPPTLPPLTYASLDETRSIEAQPPEDEDEVIWLGDSNA